MSIVVDYHAPKRVQSPVFTVSVGTDGESRVLGSGTSLDSIDLPFIHGKGRVLFQLAALPLHEGTYTLRISAHCSGGGRLLTSCRAGSPFTVLGGSSGLHRGLVHISGNWTHVPGPRDAVEGLDQ